MITGHLATALVAKKQTPDMPWWMLIVAAMLIDIAMFTFIGLGIEQLVLPAVYDGPTMSAAVVELTYSHDLLSQLFWVAFAGTLFLLLTRKASFALVAMALTFAHFLGDLISGYGHFVFGPDSHSIGTDWYHQNLLAAVIFESLVGVACVYWFVRKSELSAAKRAGLFAVFGTAPFALLVV